MKLASISLLLLTALTLACGYSAKSMPPSAGTAPAISQLVPNSTNAGGPAFNMIVNGSNFGSKAVVNWNGAALGSNTTVVSANQLTVAVPAAMIASPGNVAITVTNPAVTGSGP
jgi:hypothetical protein